MVGLPGPTLPATTRQSIFTLSHVLAGALAIAMLFVFYELFGVVTNLVGGWLGARIGLNRTMNIGLGLQLVAHALHLLLLRHLLLQLPLQRSHFLCSVKGSGVKAKKPLPVAPGSHSSRGRRHNIVESTQIPP